MNPFILDLFAQHQNAYYKPGSGPASADERAFWDEQMQTLIERNRPGADVGFEWRYLKRCHLSPSMKNRKRIWNCVKQIEKHVIAYESRCNENTSFIDA